MLYAIFFAVVGGFSFDIIKDSVLIILSMFNIGMYKITSTIEINKLINKLNIINYTISTNEKPDGIIWGKWYLGKIISSNNDYDNSKLMFVLMNKNKFKKIITQNTINKCVKSIKNSNNENNTQNINYWFRQGSFRYLYYIKRLLDVSKFISFNDQQIIIDKIVTKFETKNNLVLYLHGDPGTGKSMLCYLLTKTLSGHFCDTWNPTEPNDTIDTVYNEIMPDNSKPLILVLEEFDIIIDKVSDGQNKHKEYPIQIRDKIGWNSLLDKIQLGIYPNLILVLISNKTPKYIENKDMSYIRKGRVDMFFDIKGSKND